MNGIKFNIILIFSKNNVNFKFHILIGWMGNLFKRIKCDI